MQSIMKTRFKLKKNQKGMTLIELLAVVVILGILAAVAGVAVTKGFDSSRVNTDNTSVQVITDALSRYYMDTGTDSVSGTDETSSTSALTALQTNGYLSNVPKVQQKDKTYFKITFDSTNKVYKVSVEQ